MIRKSGNRFSEKIMLNQKASMIRIRFCDARCDRKTTGARIVRLFSLRSQELMMGIRHTR
jgi:hypothetical protein